MRLSMTRTALEVVPDALLVRRVVDAAEVDVTEREFLPARPHEVDRVEVAHEAQKTPQRLHQVDEDVPHIAPLQTTCKNSRW